MSNCMQLPLSMSMTKTVVNNIRLPCTIEGGCTKPIDGPEEHQPFGTKSFCDCERCFRDPQSKKCNTCGLREHYTTS